MSVKKSSSVKMNTFSYSALVSALLCAQHSYAAMPKAGEKIQNIAYASYLVNTENGGQAIQKIQSNPVDVEVGTYYGLDLLPDTIKQVEAGSKVIWLNELVNLSNTPAWIDFKTLDVNDLSNIKIYLDANEDGVFDLSDTLAEDGLLLEPNQHVHLWVVAETSVHTADKSTIDLPLIAQLREQKEIQDTVQDRVQVIQPKLKIEKQVDQKRLNANNTSQLIEYTLNVSNTAELPVAPVAVKVDGVTESLVIVEDPIPANTVFEDLSVTEKNENIWILHRLSEGEYTKVLPTDKNKIGYAVVAYKMPFAPQQKSSIRLKVKTNPTLSYATLVNEAYVIHRTPQLDSKKTVSNIVETEVVGKPEIDSTTGNFQQSLYTGTVNEPLYIKTNAAICNADRNVIDQVRVKVTSKLTGDVVYVNAIESEENSGVFQFDLETQENLNQDLKDAILQTLKRDSVNINLTDCLDATGQSTLSIEDVETDVLIDPYGVVFDAKTGAPVAGATVILVDEFDQPVADNIAYEIDRFTGELKSLPARQVTNEHGQFAYPLVRVGTYKLLIDTSTIPDNKKYSFVSQKGVYPVESFNGKMVDPDWSYAGAFTLTKTSPALNIDIPIDPELTETSLIVEKTARDTSVELGDFTNYSITVTNNGSNLAEDVKLQDTLPRGFSYVPNTMRVNGQPVADPIGGKGPYLTLGLGSLDVSKSAKIEYRVQIGPNALNGDGINRARAVDSTGKQSNEAQAKVTVRPGVFSSDAFVVGKVYTDCNRNGMQDSGELGVPGVRLFMEDGSYVITDREGKYDFYGVSPKTHVLKLDRTTLPAGAELIIQSNRNTGDPSSSFVDVRAGELHRTDFAIANEADTCSAPLLDAVKQRQENINKQNFNLEKAINKQLSIDAPVYTQVSTRSGNTDGCLVTEGEQNCLLNKNNSNDQAKPSEFKVKSMDSMTAIDLEERLRSSDSNTLDILNLVDGQVLKYNQTTIQIQGALGATQRVSINGKIIDEKHIGKRASLAENRKLGLEYIGVPLEAGKNTLLVEQLDFIGNVRESKEMTLMVPSDVHHIVSQPKAVAVANGKDSLLIKVQIQDKNGISVLTRTPVTLESDLGQIDLADSNPTQNGVQTFIENGELIVPIIAPSVPGQGKLRISSGIIKQEVDIQFTADLRPLIAVGLVEGSINFNKFDSKNLHSVNASDGFEEELQEIADFGGDTNLTGRTAVYLKGKVKGDYLLTLAYDSDKSSKQRLFRDIQPDEYYPVYGDAAAKGFDAQSTSKLYVRLDKGRSFAMYGDYITRTEQDEGLSLGQYNRSLTGVKIGHETDKLKVSAFGAQTKSRQIAVDHRAMGITGPYSLGTISSDLILENSEKVEVITRDRNNPGLIIDRRVLTRFVDYEIDTYSNSIYLKEAVASIDTDLNPNYIRITVEAEEIGQEYEVAGLSFSYALPSNLKVGGSFVRSNDPLQSEQIVSANAVLKLGTNGKLIAEVAHSENSSSSDDQLVQVGQPDPLADQTGTAARIEYNYSEGTTSIQAYHQQADTGFKNDAATISAGRVESGIKAERSFENIGKARIEGIRTEDQVNQGVRTGLSASLERNFFKVVALETGIRFYDETDAGATLATDSVDTYSGTTARVKASTQLPWKNANVFAEYEQDVSEADNKVLTVGGRMKVAETTELYAHHEVISALDGLYSLSTTEKTNSTMFGISSTYMKDSSVYSEYRVADGMSNREAEAALGLKNRWEVQPKVYLSTSFEKTKSLSADETQNNESTAASVGVEYLPKDDWKAMTRLEGRRSDNNDTWLNTIGYARKINDDVTFLAKNTFNLVDSDSKDTGDHLRNRFQFGLAWRDFDSNQLDILSKLEHFYEKNETSLDNIFTRQSYISSTHFNYHPYRQLTLSGQYAAKWSVLDEYHVESSAFTQMLNGRILYDLNERWDMGVQAGALWANRGAGTRYLAGVELGYLVATNFWLSAGYNFFGYHDDDLANTSSTGEGAYLRFRFKFDEDLFGRRNSMINASLEPQQGDR